MNCVTYWLEGVEPAMVEKNAVDLGGVGEAVTAATAHPGNDSLLLGTASGKVVVWDPTQACMTHMIEAHSQEVTRIEFTPDGKNFITASLDCDVHLWDSQFERWRTFTSPSPVLTAAISQNAEMLAAGGDDQTLRVWDVESSDLRHSFANHTAPITACAWTGPTNVVTGTADGRVSAWAIELKRIARQTRQHQDRVSLILLSRDRSWYATASWDKTIAIFNSAHKLKFTLPAGSAAVTALALTADDRTLAAGHWDGVVRVFNIETGKMVDEFAAHETSLIGAAIVAGSQYLVTADANGSLRSWNLSEMGITRYVHKHSGEAFSLQYTPDNLNLLSVGYDGQLKLWDRNERAESGYIDGQEGPITACAIAPDNQWWAVGAADGALKLWNVAEESFEASFIAHDQMVSDIAFLPLGGWLITASWDMKLRLWHMKTRQSHCVYHGHTKEVSACDISPDGRRLISASWDCTARLWDLTDRDREFVREMSVLEGHTERLLCCSFSPDGMRIATGSADQSVRLWSVDKITDAKLLFGHQSAVTACQYTPDGQLLLTADRDGRVMLWDAHQGELLCSLDHERPILDIDISPDGEQAAIADETGCVRFMHLDYVAGPNWITAQTVLKPPPIWKRGSPALEFFDVSCVYCGRGEQLKKAQLGQAWRCPQCNSVLMVCPRGLAPEK